jgi:hypothetical protein
MPPDIQSSKRGYAMTVFPNWQQYAVQQRRPLTGCIPTGYEIILRATGATDINYEAFQDQFDLDRDLALNVPMRNNFQSVADAVRDVYPQIDFRRREFLQENGHKKLEFIEQQISQLRPILVSLFMGMYQGRIAFHIMPVVDADDGHLFLLYGCQPPHCSILKIYKQELVRRHNTVPGGNDVAFLARS